MTEDNVIPFVSLEERKQKINNAIVNMPQEMQVQFLQKMFPDHEVVTLEDGSIAISGEPKYGLVEYTDEQMDIVKVGIIFAIDYLLSERENGLDLNYFFDHLEQEDYEVIIDETLSMHAQG